MALEYLNALLAGFALSFMIGPVFFVLLETSATRGIKEAILFDIGVITADIFFIIIAYYGSHTFLNNIKDDPRLFFIGGMILFTYGLISFLKEKRKKESLDLNIVIQDKVSGFGLAIKGFLLNFINVGVLAFWLLLVLDARSKFNSDSKKIFWYFFIVILGYFIMDLGKIVWAKQLKRKMTPIFINRIRKLMGIILMVIGIGIASKGLIPEKTMKKIKEKTEEVIDKVK